MKYEEQKENIVIPIPSERAIYHLDQPGIRQWWIKIRSIINRHVMWNLILLIANIIVFIVLIAVLLRFVVQ